MSPMMEVVKFAAAHLQDFNCAREIEAKMMAAVLADPTYGEALAREELAFSGFVRGTVVACAGLIQQWPGRALTWALMSAEARPFMTQITRAIVRQMDRSGIRRIESAVDVSYPVSQRWHTIMGFEREGLMRAYTPDGRDCFLYARVKQTAP
jgi:RimJ/RimL family protein N-acetyltransferase